MNSIHRVGVTIAGLVTLAVVGGAFVVQGYFAAQTAAAQATTLAVQATATDQPTRSATATPTLPPAVVYVMPKATAPVIHIIRRAKPAPTAKPGPTATPPIIHIIVPGPTGGDDGGSGD
jgi:hypothetical protein